MPMENFLIRYHSSNIERFSNTSYEELLNIAIKIRSHWLLKEIMCRIIADPQWEDPDLKRDFSDSDAGELLLCKRAELRDMLKTIDRRVILIQQPKNTRGKLDERAIR